MKKLFIAKFGLGTPAIAWDGILAPEYLINDQINPAYKICIDESEDLKMANLDVGNDFENIDTDAEKFKCEI